MRSVRFFRLSLWLVLGFACLYAAPIAPQAHAIDPAVAIAKKENAARKKCASELLKLAKWCALQRGFDAALAEVDRGLSLRPDDTKLLAEKKRLTGREAKPRKGFLVKLDVKRQATYGKCVKALSSVAQQYDNADLIEAFHALLDSARTTFPGDDIGASFGLVYFDPYLKWVRKADLARLEAGAERIDGEWLDAAAVAELDKQHADWSTPWKISDERHEVITTMPLRTARSVLAHVGATRKFMLDYFDGEWDLRTPKGKLPVILTATRAELIEQANAGPRGTGVPATAAAFYRASNSDLNPCFLTFEPMMANGKIAKIGFEELLFPLKHEIAHQVAFEYSKHHCDRTRMSVFQFWSIEGLANFLPYHVVGRDGWTLTHPKTVPFAGGGGSPGSFAWTQRNLASLPSLAELFQKPQALIDANTYHHCATIAYFLLEGLERKYRKGFIALVADVHACRDKQEMWSTHFPDTPLEQVQAEFDAFVRAIELDK